jgi:Global regulator protein family
MLVLRRKEGQWIEITHPSGDRVRIRVYNIRSGFPGHLDLAFDDAEHHYTIRRGEHAVPCDHGLS